MENAVSVEDFARHFALTPEVLFLNHGSFGACPRIVLDVQSELRARMEREPVYFFVNELEGLLDEARAAIAELVGADGEDLALCHNATTAVNAVLGSLRFAPDDEILCTDHGYNACNNALHRTAQRTGARVVIVHIPFPIASAAQVTESVLSAVTPRTRLLLIDHVTSPTGLVLPVEKIVPALAERGIDTLIDGAHAPGMLPIDLRALQPAYYTGNLHKWCCAPKGAAFLFVRRALQPQIHPAITSHGMNSPRRDRSRFLLEFDWVGSDDYSAVLSAPAALRFLRSLLPGGLPALMLANREKALAARRVLTAALYAAPPCPDDMIGTLAAVPLPDIAAADLATARARSGPTCGIDPLQLALYERHHIQVPIMPFPAPPRRLVRISAQCYNHAAQYAALASALKQELAAQ